MIRNKQKFWLVWFAISLLALAVIVLVTPSLLPSALIALVAYYFLNPFVMNLKRFGLAHGTAVHVVYFGVGFIILTVTVILTPLIWDEASEFIRLLPQISRTFLVTLQNKIKQFEDSIGYVLPTPWLNEIPSLMIKAGSWVGGQIPQWLSQSTLILFLAPLLTYFFLKEGHTYPSSLVEQLAPHWQERLFKLAHALNGQIGGFIRARMIESLLVGAATWLGLVAFKMPFALLLGVVAGLFNIVPYLGPVTAFIPAGILAFTTQEPLLSFTLTAGLYLVVQMIDAFVLVPFLVARIVQLHPLVVIISILFGAHVMGILGMIISIPIAGMVKVTALHIKNWVSE